MQAPFSPKLIVVPGASSQLSSLLNLPECAEGCCIPKWSAQMQQHQSILDFSCSCVAQFALLSVQFFATVKYKGMLVYHIYNMDGT